MYIISKHKDYYDSAVGMGIDKTIVYERKPRQEKVPKELSDFLNQYDHYSFVKERLNKKIVNYSTSVIHIGFCGKIYLGIRLNKEFENSYTYDKIKEVEMMWNHDTIRKKLNPEVKYHKYRWFKNQKSELELFNNYVAKLEAYDATKWFREFNSPIFAISGPPIDDSYSWRQSLGFNNKDGELFVNPILKEYQFAKVFDPYTAFQEVQMYVSGVLGVSKDGTDFPATEKEKVAQHGMNKWSFRRPSRK